MTGLSNPHAFDADETAALDAIGWHAGGGRCPDSALLLAAEEGVLPPELAARVSSHVSSCATCQMLVKDLAIVLADDDADAAGRIRSRIDSGSSRRARAAVWIGVAGLAAAAAIVWFLVAPRGGPAPQAPESEIARATPRPAPTVFIVDRPLIPPGDVDLTVRGDSSTRVSLESQIATALDKADSGDVPAAVSALSALVQSHKNSRVAALALGASQLRAGQNADAVVTLERARSLKGDAATSHETEWFLGMALVRTGDRERARALLSDVCTAKGPRTASACAGVAEIDRDKSGR